jgi:hypothetical protein
VAIRASFGRLPIDTDLAQRDQLQWIVRQQQPVFGKLGGIGGGN